MAIFTTEQQARLAHVQSIPASKRSQEQKAELRRLLAAKEAATPVKESEDSNFVEEKSSTSEETIKGLTASEIADILEAGREAEITKETKFSGLFSTQKEELTKLLFPADFGAATPHAKKSVIELLRWKGEDLILENTEGMFDPRFKAFAAQILEYFLQDRSALKAKKAKNASLEEAEAETYLISSATYEEAIAKLLGLDPEGSLSVAPKEAKDSKGNKYEPSGIILRPYLDQHGKVQTGFKLTVTFYLDGKRIEGQKPDKSRVLKLYGAQAEIQETKVTKVAVSSLSLSDFI